MIVRVWSCRCERPKLEGFKSFIHSEFLPELKRNDGCLQALVAQDTSLSQPRIIIITVWRDLDSIKRFTGPQWRNAIVNPKAAVFIDGEPKLEHFELVDEKQALRSDRISSKRVTGT
jgi:quinol monooxygenase YgiN